MAPGIQVTPEDLRALAKRIDARISPHLDKAQSLLDQARGVEQGLYTSVTWLFATVYVTATEFTGEDIKRKRDDLGKVVTTLDETAQRWADAEEKNTIKGN